MRWQSTASHICLYHPIPWAWVGILFGQSVHTSPKNFEDFPFHEIGQFIWKQTSTLAGPYSGIWLILLVTEKHHLSKTQKIGGKFER
jgi:hypothetical protein